MKDRILAACDIGSSKICCGIGRIDVNGQFALIGFGETESKGLKKGVVVNIEHTTKNIKDAVYTAEIMSGHFIEDILINVGGDHLIGTNSKGVVAISGRNNEINRDDISRVIEAARTMVIPKGREILHVLEQEYVVDDQIGIKEPLGMSGVRLEASVHIISGSVALIKNLKNAIIRANYGYSDIILSSLCSSEACLSQDEKELGVMLVDIGSETTDVICYNNMSVHFTDVIPMGASNITKDIAIMLKIPIKEAEILKTRSGVALSSLIKGDEQVEVPSIGANQARLESKKYVSEIIEARLKELFQQIAIRIKKFNLDQLIPSGIVLTGGGAQLAHLENFVYEYMSLPVRIGYPFGFKTVEEKVFQPQYSAMVGLLMLGLSEDDQKTQSKGKNSFLDSFKGFFKSFGR